MTGTRPHARSRLRWCALVGACVMLAMSAASASADSGPFSGALVSQRSLVAAAPSTAQIDRALKQRTGYPAGQLTTAALCPKPANPGVPQCAAQVLVTRSGHKILHLSAGPRQRPEEMRPAGTPANSGPIVGQGWPAPFTPGYLQEAYDLSWLSAHNGAGDTVAIVDLGYDATAASDLATFRSHYSLSVCNTSPCFQQVNQYGQPALPSLGAANADWQGETSLDLDAVSSICPNCNILLVEIGTVTNPPYNSSDSTGTAEQTAATLGADQISNSWSEGTTSAPSTTFTFPGVLTVASAGDAGYTGASWNNYPAALPGVVAVGGTTLAQSGVAAGRGFGESTWNSSSEQAATGSGCDTYESKPAYQTDVGCAGRAGNDISADADPQTGLDIVNQGTWEQYGGTSLSAPLVAAYAALIGQHTNSPAWIYDPNFAADLFDPVTGNDVDANSCATAVSYICTAGLGYDGPTGNGSISGTVVAGAPGVGSASGVVSASGTQASVVGGVYPNGLDTTYYWQYGPTTAYGQQTSPVDVGAGQGVVATSDTLTRLTGSYVHFRLVATNSDGTVYGYDTGANVTYPGASAPANTSVPQISGAAVTGQTLSASAGTWNPAPGAFSYQWQLSINDSTWTNVAGATGVQYQVPVSDPGDYLRVQVTAGDDAGQSAPAVSAATTQVTTLVPWSSAAPQITGTALNGQTLTASTGTWAPGASEGYAYQWQRSPDGSSWTDITGQTTSTYTLSNTDVGDMIRVQVTAFDSHGASPPASSAPIASVISKPVNTSPPTITGIPKRLDTLTVTPGQWSFVAPNQTYSYQWQYNTPDNPTFQNVAADGTSSTYTLGVGDESEHFQVVVTATTSNGTTTATSDATAPVTANPPYTPYPPTIDGTAAVGQPLTVVNYTFGPSDVGAVSYQWQRSGDDGTSWTNITGQIGAASTYTPVLGDAGDQIQAALSATNLDGTTIVVTNAVTVPPVPVNQTAPSITGTVQSGAQLTTSPGTWTGSPSSVTLQWVSCPANTAIASCPVVGTGSTYTPSHGDVGNRLAVIATATNSSGSGVADSPPTVTVPAPPAILTLPTIGGPATRGSTLVIGSTGVWTNANISTTYVWEQCDGNGLNCATISADPSLTLTTTMEANTIRLLVTATGSGGSTQAASAPVGPVNPVPPVNQTPPTIQGTAQVGDLLSATGGTWNTSLTSSAWQWSACNSSGTGCSAIAGQTGPNFELTAAYAGDDIVVSQLASNADASNVAAPSAPFGPIAAPVVVTPPPSIGAGSGSGSPQPPFAVEDPALSGAFTIGTTITAQPATWNNNTTSAVVQIIRCVSPGSGCTPVGTTSYTITNADAGHYFYALATASNAVGTTTQRQAAADYGPVPAPTTAPSSLTGTTKIMKTGTKPVKALGGEEYATAKLTAVKRSKKRKLVVARAPGITVPVTAWACQTTGKKRCLPKRTSTGSLSWTTTLTGPLKIIVTLN